MRGNGWYSQPMVEYCLKKKLIVEADIKYVVIASIQIDENYFNELLTGAMLTWATLLSWLSIP